MVRVKDEEIKEIVREHYAEVARNASGCCGPSCCADDQEKDLYTIQEIEGLPTEAVMASAGCGNPTAMGSLKPGETVVDFGSGGGIDCFLAAKMVGETGKVIGVDMTTDMVNLARENAKKLGLPNVEFHLTDMEHTPIDSDSVDAIISNCVINLAPDKDAVFQEAFRILKPGGRVYVSDMVLIEDLPEDVATDTKNWVACLSGAGLKDVYLGYMRNAGFEDIEVVSETPLKETDGWRASVRSMNIKATKPA